MTDVAGNQLVKQVSKPEISAFGSNNPIESCGSTKQSNDDMEIDSEGANLHNPRPNQVNKCKAWVNANLPRKLLLLLPVRRSQGQSKENAFNFCCK